MRNHFLRAATGKASLWTPAQITTALWLDAADTATVTTVSSAVSQWNDKSGNARHATQSTSGSRPTLTSSGLNGLGVVTFDGTDDWLTAGAAADWAFLNGTGGAEVVFLIKPGTSSDPNTLYGLYNTNNGTVNNTGSYIIYDDRSSASRNNACAFATTTSGTAIVSDPSNLLMPNQPSILNVVLDLGNLTASSKVSNYVNGTFFAGNNTSVTSPVTGTPFSALHIGRFSSALFYLSGYIAEIIISSSILSASNRERIEGYLAHKWGLTANLPVGHPYKSAAPT
jgi:hypothetical protein